MWIQTVVCTNRDDFLWYENRDLIRSLRRCVQSSAVSTLRLKFPSHFLRYKIPYGCNMLCEITQTWGLLISAVNTILPKLKFTFSGVLVFLLLPAYHTCIPDLLLHRLRVVKILCFDQTAGETTACWSWFSKTIRDMCNRLPDGLQ